MWRCNGLMAAKITTIINMSIIDTKCWNRYPCTKNETFKQPENHKETSWSQTCHCVTVVYHMGKYACAAPTLCGPSYTLIKFVVTVEKRVCWCFCQNTWYCKINDETFFCGGFQGINLFETREINFCLGKVWAKIMHLRVYFV